MNKNQSPLKLLWLFLALNLFGSTIAIILNFRSQTKIGYVDEIELLKNYKDMENVKFQLDETSKSWKVNLDTLKREVELAIDSYEKDKKRMLPQEKLQLEEGIKSKKKQFLDYQQVVQEKYQKQEKELLDKLLVKVNARIKKYANDNGFEIILSSGEQSNLAYASDKLNLTNTLVEILNSEYK